MSMFELLRYESPDSWILLESRSSPFDCHDDDDDENGGEGGSHRPAVGTVAEAVRHLFRRWLRPSETEGLAGVGR